MAELGHLRAFLDSVGLVGLKTANRLGGALTDAEGSKYTFEKAASDTFGFYNDLFAALFGLATGEIAVPTPSITIKIKEGTAQASVTASLGLSAAPLERTDLLKVGLPAVPKIPRADVTLKLNAPDLTIELVNLAAVKTGVYKGLVFVQATNEPIVELLLRVVP